MRIDMALCLPRDAESVAVARDVAMSALARLGVQTTYVEDIRIALSEACNNVIEHAHGEDEYEVRIAIEDHSCEISVIDYGHGFDGESLGHGFPDPRSPAGRGVALMRALVDQVKFSSEPQRGTVVHLVKRVELEPDGALHRLLSRDER
jgi:serine/threonine-protein kinase RsbW